MKKILISTTTICAVIAGLFLIQIAPAMADEWGPHHHFRHHRHLAYVEYVPESGACRVGWWQTLRYGHVRPHWAVWCR